jgi:hypothetical protein
MRKPHLSTAPLTGSLISGWVEKTGRRENVLAAALIAVLVGAQLASAAAPAEYAQVYNAWKTSLRLIDHPERAASLASRLEQSYQAAQFTNTRLPGSARILFVGETRPYYFRRDIVVPSAYDEHPLRRVALPGRPPGEIRRTLIEQGFTHLLFHRSEWERFGEQTYRSIWKKEDRMAVDKLLAELPVVYRHRAISVHSLEGIEKPLPTGAKGGK